MRQQSDGASDLGSFLPLLLPSDCCPKNSGPGNKPAKSRKPVHFGTGQEILYQTDFALERGIPIVWTLCYRSGAECEDWGLLGAR